MLEMMTASPKKVAAKGNIKKFGTGANGIVALADSGNLYSIGDSNFNGGGAANTTWKQIATGVANVWVSYRAILALTTDGRWLFQGTNNFFPTTIGSNVATMTDVSAYMTYTAGLTIKEVSMGFRSLAVVFTNGQYAMCGTNSSGGLGIGSTTAVRGLTMRTDHTDVKKIVFDYVATDTSVMLKNNGDAYAAGDSNLGQTGNLSSVTSTWLKQTAVAGIVDISFGASGWFRVVETSSDYRIYVQGRHDSGSLGTGATGTANYTAPTAVNPVITDKSKGAPVIYPGLYSARFNHPNGAVYYTGTASGSIQGTGEVTNQQTTKYSFTALAAATLAGEYYANRASYSSAYIVLNKTLYGTGQDATLGLLPGLGTTRALLFVPLDTTAVI